MGCNRVCHDPHCFDDGGHLCHDNDCGNIYRLWRGTIRTPKKVDELPDEYQPESLEEKKMKRDFEWEKGMLPEFNKIRKNLFVELNKEPGKSDFIPGEIHGILKSLIHSDAAISDCVIDLIIRVSLYTVK